MSRYRPPAPPASFYITPQGMQVIRDELDYLWRKKRPEVTQAVSEAAALGDRSENAEYIYGKKQLREIDRRVRYLRKRIEQLKVVSEPPSDQGRVYFGAWVTLEGEDKQHRTHRIVGPDEFDLDNTWISMDSPMAKALMGRGLGESVVVDLPDGAAQWAIRAIRYECK